MVKDRFQETETYHNMDMVWGQLRSKFNEQQMFYVEQSLLSDVNKHKDYEYFVKKHFEHFLREIDVGSIVRLQGVMDIEGVVLKINGRCFQIKVIESSDEATIGRTVNVDEEMMSNYFDNCYV